jgi:hypothetical protein
VQFYDISCVESIGLSPLLLELLLLIVLPVMLAPMAEPQFVKSSTITLPYDSRRFRKIL